MKNIFVGYENGNGISPYFVGAEKRKLSFTLFAQKNIPHRQITLAIKLYQLGIHKPYLNLLGNWTNELDQLSQIIFTASREAMPALDFIHKKYPKIKCHVYYLNTLETEVASLEEWKKYYCKIWTFDQNDAKTHKLNQIAQPICKESFDGLDHSPLLYDLVFVGEDKKRLGQLLALEAELKSQGLKPVFDITCTYLPNQSEGVDYAYAQPMPYEKVLEKYSQSVAVLEILQAGQTSATMRAVEAGFLHKKIDYE